MDVRVEAAPMGATAGAVREPSVFLSIAIRDVHVTPLGPGLSLTPVISVNGHSISAVQPDVNVLEDAVSVNR